ncbi:MAG: rhomboid family intramembrane serine protease, partial [Gammaproteobacteria bacterium]
ACWPARRADPMFPIRDDNPQLLTPFATWALVALNIAAWALLEGLGSQPALARAVCTLGLVPGELFGGAPPGSTLPLAPGIECVIGTVGNPLTLLTHMFLHGGWMHLIGNLWFLWIFGNNVEDAMGAGRFVAFYLLCGLAAAAAQILSNPDAVVPMVGASGAIGGVMGAYVVLFPRVNVHMLFWFGFYVTTFAVPAFWMLGYWFLVQMLGGFNSLGAEGGGTAFWAHVGGFGAGALLVRLFVNRRLLEGHPYHGWRHPAAGAWRRLR